MAYYVEVMCNLRKRGHHPKNILIHRCWSDRNENPQGNTLRSAAKEARRLGWKVDGSYAECPDCQDGVDDVE